MPFNELQFFIALTKRQRNFIEHLVGVVVLPPSKVDAAWMGPRLAARGDG